MATHNKHSQTYSLDFGKTNYVSSEMHQQAMYDDTVEVSADEVDSPSSLDEEPIMSKFNPPKRQTSRHGFDTETSDSDDEILNNFIGKSSDNTPERPIHSTVGRPRHSNDRKSLSSQSSKELLGSKSSKSVLQLQSRESSDHSDSDSNDLERGEPSAPSSSRTRIGVVFPTEGVYDPAEFQDLDVPPEMDNVFQYIMKYTPQKVEIDFKLQPFVPEYVPAVGDIDAFIKITNPSCGLKEEPLSNKLLEFIDNLGLNVLDEPSAEQSDSTLLHLQLRATSKISSAKTNVVTKNIENAERNPKQIERWIKDVSELHLSKPAPSVDYSVKMPEIDTLMEEWPAQIEEVLNEVGIPPPSLQCTLSEYVAITCAIFDIPIEGKSLNECIQALHMLFSLYLAVKNSHLHVERQKEIIGD